MIIFDLDGTLADCEHRRHFVQRDIACDHWHQIPNHPIGMCNDCKARHNAWKPDWKSFYEACDKDEPVWPSISILNRMLIDGGEDINIWSGRCESVKDKTIRWLKDHLEVDAWFYRDCIKMRPIADSTPDYALKERWLNERCPDLISNYFEEKPYPTKHDIDFVFDSDPKSISMWKRRGIFVFNCLQHDGEF